MLFWKMFSMVTSPKNPKIRVEIRLFIRISENQKLDFFDR
jgi:hypothetical protein